MSTTASSGAYVMFDLGAGTTLRLRTSFTMRSRCDTTVRYPTSWLVQGSNNGTSWTTAITVTGSTLLNGRCVWNTFSPSGATYYRYLRIAINGSNAFNTSGTNEIVSSYHKLFIPDAEFFAL